MSDTEYGELERFRKTTEHLSGQHRGENGPHEERMQASEIGSLIRDPKDGHNDAILRFVEEGDSVLFGVSEEEREKWLNLSPDIKQQALEFYALLRHYFDKGDQMDIDELKHLEEYFKRFLLLIRDSSQPHESDEKVVH